MTESNIKARLQRAIEALLSQDAPLLKYDVNERLITHKLAEHLQQEFPGWNVDCEYNRDGHDSKRLDLRPTNDVSSADTEARTVFPDIIVHRRRAKDNLLVLEAKKSTGTRANCDKQKLRAFKEQLKYKYAVFVRIPVGNSRSQQAPQVEWE